MKIISGKLNSNLWLTLSIIIFSMWLTACSDDDDNVTTPGIDKNNIKIAVFSDPHLYDPSLGVEGSAFQMYLASDRKLIAESDAIMQSIVNNLKNSDADIVLVPGDLTKDGEKTNHERFASYMKQLESAGKKVYVIPGNHDVLNPASFSYLGDTPTPVANTTVTDFSTIYNDFGYSEAIAKDPSSLSYVCEPVSGLWIIGIDDCRYTENSGQGHSVTGGKLSEQTRSWIKSQIITGVSKGKLVIGMMHHGLLEHFSGQKSFPISFEYVIDDWEIISEEFANAGMKAVFTGHYHANDIVKKTSSNGFIYDIETGSLVTSPCPYRNITLKNLNTMTITTNYVESVNYNTGGKSFQAYASEYLLEGMTFLVNYTLTEEYQIPETQANLITPIITDAFISHYNGDEKITADAQNVIAALNAMQDQQMSLFATMIQSFYTDLPPADNNIVIDLSSGATM